jgi:integral membrane protein
VATTEGGSSVSDSPEGTVDDGTSWAQPSMDGSAAQPASARAGFVHPMTPIIPPDEIPRVRAALIRYRVMAYTVGVLLVALMLFAVPMKYFGHDDRWVTWFGVPHGLLYMLLIITAIDLGRRVKWSVRNVVLIALAGTVPFLSFVAEFIARRDVNRRIAESNPIILR